MSLIVLRVSARSAILDGIVVDGVHIGGMAYAQAGEILDNEYSNLLMTSFDFNFQNEVKSITLGELGVTFDSQATLESIKEFSYGEGFIDHIEKRLITTFSEFEAEPIFIVDDNVMQSQLLLNFPSLKMPKDASLNVKNGEVVEVLPHEDGLTMDFEDMKTQLYLAINNPDTVSEIAIKPIEIPADYRTEQAEQDGEKLKVLLKAKVRFFYTESREKTYEFKNALEPSWVTIKNSEFIFNEPGITDYIKNNIPTKIDVPLSNAIIKEMPEEGGLYPKVEGIAIDGVTVDVAATLGNFKTNVKALNFEIPVVVNITPAKVINETGVDLGSLERISRGKSGFKGSAINRKFNIKKGLEERLNNLLIPPGAEFSFNDVVGPVEGSYGWKSALTIFNGDELKPAPGGGLCQVSTTTYRAVLDAGLEILEQSNHSLYILYYEEYGNGLDAAVFPGSKDFRFKNTSDGYLFFQAYVVGDTAYVDFYGMPVNKSVELIGPFYHAKVPEAYKAQLEPNWNQIGWIQKITKNDGSVIENVLYGSYKTKPRKLYPYGGE